MIEKVNKYLFLIFHKEYKDFLIQLRSLGVVHIQPTKAIGEVEELQSLLQQRRELSDQIKELERLRSKGAPEVSVVEVSDPGTGKAALDHLKQLWDRRALLSNQIEAQKRENAYWNVWGDYSLKAIDRLTQKGYPVDFYVCPSQQYKEEWEEEFNAIAINAYRANTYFITVGNSSEHHLEAERIKPPTKELAELDEQLRVFQEALQQTKEEIQDFADRRIGELKGYEILLSNHFNFSNALIQATAEADNRLMCLEGWVTEDDRANMEEQLSQTACYMQPLEIQEGDSVPVKLKNNAFARLFEPITKMYSLPNYTELDATALFAPFFVLFFSLCFGDAGYGVLIFLLATLFKRKQKKGSSGRDLCSLGQWLGGVSAVVGSLLGTVFGMVMPWANDGSLLGGVRDTYFLNQDNLMYLSVILGILQIIFGKFVAALKTHKQKGLKYALAPFAWVVIIVSLIGALAVPALWTSAPAIVGQAFYGLAIAAALVAFFYNSPGRNPLLNFGSGLWTTYNVASGLLGDTLSYIRLFAIGLTSGVLGGVFNNLAVDMTSGLPIGVNYIVMALILLFGHSLNFGLAVISSLVHPLRLTFVEFYKNSEFEGGGREFTPFRLTENK
ncbi:MAG: V-type ATPase 116kDa subunit family protein [Porphyromonas sp.]|nr:V-type ATPase 116kDa subunit family protein [Porphyromonas sp.]